jgi:hypothetical protein
MSGTLFDQDYSAGILPGTTAQLDAGTEGGAGSVGVSLGTGTGQHGTQTVDTANGNPFAMAWAWLNTPFTTNMSPWSVMLLVGVVLIAILLWNMVLYHVRIAAETI